MGKLCPVGGHLAKELVGSLKWLRCSLVEEILTKSHFNVTAKVEHPPGEFFRLFLSDIKAAVLEDVTFEVRGVNHEQPGELAAGTTPPATWGRRQEI